MLQVEHLTIDFQDDKTEETLVHDFCLTMNPGEIIGLVGESGSGKTLTALSIAGLLKRSGMKKQGAIYFEDTDLLTCSRTDLRNLQGKEITMVFQEPMTSLNPLKKIGWQVEESLRIHTSLSKQERYQLAIESMKAVELKEAELIYHQYPHQLSGGMRQRIMIAAAMIMNPKLLIADEITTALDVTVQAQIIELLKKLNREKKTAILFISHDLSLVKRLCNRVLVMQQGNVVEENTSLEIFQNPKEEYTRQLIAAIPKFDKKRKELPEC